MPQVRSTDVVIKKLRREYARRSRIENLIDTTVLYLGILMAGVAIGLWLPFFLKWMNG